MLHVDGEWVVRNTHTAVAVAVAVAVPIPVHVHFTSHVFSSLVFSSDRIIKSKVKLMTARDCMVRQSAAARTKP